MGSTSRLLVALAGLFLLAGTLAPAQNYIGNPVNMYTNQISVSAVNATLIEGNRARSSVTIENLGTNQVCFAGTNAVTLSNAPCLPGTVGASVTIPYTGAVWGLATTGSTTVAVMDLY